jgi:hypothetical protein
MGMPEGELAVSAPPFRNEIGFREKPVMLR